MPPATNAMPPLSTAMPVAKVTALPAPVGPSFPAMSVVYTSPLPSGFISVTKASFMPVNPLAPGKFDDSVDPATYGVAVARASLWKRRSKMSHRTRCRPDRSPIPPPPEVSELRDETVAVAGRGSWADRHGEIGRECLAGQVGIAAAIDSDRFAFVKTVALR